MKYLLDQIKEITRKIQKSRGLLLISDFDGTLSPIVSDYRLAAIDPEAKAALAKAAANGKIKIILISGRELSDLKSRASLSGVAYSGTHGLEWEINGKYERYGIDHEIFQSLKDAKTLLKEIAKTYPGIEVEEKNLSIAVHYRSLDNITEAEFKKYFYDVTGKSAISEHLKFVEGKKVIDLRPKVDWDKGKAAKMISAPFKDYLAIVIGDDTTDEDLFKSFPDGITVKVGYENRSSAEYFLENVEEVARFINSVSDTLPTPGSTVR